MDYSRFLEIQHRNSSEIAQDYYVTCNHTYRETSRIQRDD